MGDPALFDIELFFFKLKNLLCVNIAVQYRGLHVYRISMIVVGLITQIIEFYTDIF